MEKSMINLEHPSITRCLETGYPDAEPEPEEFDEDAAYEERREREMGWID